MPTNLVKPGQEADWDRAKKLAEEQGKKENWPYINSIFQSLIGNKTAATGRMPGNALTGPARYGLMPVFEYFGVIREDPHSQVVTTGEQVKDKRGDIWFFVGLGADNKPILAKTEQELEHKKQILEKSRLHSESVHMASKVAARYKELFEHPPEGEGSMVPPLRDINGENFKAPEFAPMELLGYKWKNMDKKFHNPQPEPAGVVRVAAQKPVYVGAFLTHASKQKLLHEFPAMHPQVFAEHCTLWFKPSEAELAAYTIGDMIDLHVRMGFIDEKGQAVTVDIPNGIPCKNPHPHITVSCAPGTAPVYSNQLIADRAGMQTVSLRLEAVIDTFPRSVL